MNSIIKYIPSRSKGLFQLCAPKSWSRFQILEKNQKSKTYPQFTFLIGGFFSGIIVSHRIYNYFYGNSVHAAQIIEKFDKEGISRRNKYNFIADVVQETSGSLVYIEIKDMGIRDYYTGQPVTSSNGSGFIVESDGLILTNAHVVINKPRASVYVRLENGKTYKGMVEDIDILSDLATIRIAEKNLPTMKLGVSSSVRPGEFVIALGSPLSLSNTITTGVVSSVARQKSEIGIQGKNVPEYIQTDAAITFGNSGGPLINLDGEAIGINSMKITPGISFAIPIDYAKEFLNRSKKSKNKNGFERRRYIGITMLTLSPQIIDELRGRMEIPSTISHGIIVFKMVRDSPSDQSGVLPGDIVTHINNVPITGSSDVYKFLEDLELDVLILTIYRKNRFIKLKIYPENPNK